MRRAVLAEEHSHAKPPLVSRMLPRPDEELARLIRAAATEQTG
jgi:hypothetical protein